MQDIIPEELNVLGVKVSRPFENFMRFLRMWKVNSLSSALISSQSKMLPVIVAKSCAISSVSTQGDRNEQINQGFPHRVTPLD